MIINTKAETFESNMTSSGAQFGISDMSAIMDILQNRLYSNKKQTLVQEYMCNGRDASREIKSKRPIEVTVPSIFSLFFKVRDFGPGISHDRMFKVFINYGASTKRDSNSQTGGFGIGAKAGFSYTSSFQITTFIDGVKTTYLAHIGKSKQGNLDVIGQEATTEENGTEISIPVQKNDISDFSNAATRASFFWEESGRPVFKNLGEVQFHDFSYQVGSVTISKYSAKESYRYESSVFLLVDGIIYPMDELAKKINADSNNLVDEMKRLFNRNYNVFISVPNGFVNVSASRERIEDTDFTFSNLIPHLKKASKAVKADYEDKKTFTTFSDALVGAKAVTGIYNTHNFKVGSWTLEVNENSNVDAIVMSPLLDSVIIQNMELNQKGDYREIKTKARNRYSNNKVAKIDHSRCINGRVINLDSTEAPVIANRKVKQYMQSSGIKSVTVLKFDDSKTTPEQKQEVIDTLKCVSVQTLPYDKQVVARQKRDIDNSLCPLYVYTGYSNKTVKNYTNEELAEFDKIVYVPFEVISNHSGFYYLSTYFSKNLFVGATKTSLKKLSSMSNAIDYTSWEAEINPTEKDKKGYVNQQVQNHVILTQICSIDGVTSTVIKELETAYKPYKGVKMSDKLPGFLQNKIQEDKEVKKALQTIQNKIKMVETTFPLLNKISLGRMSKEEQADLTSYLNSK